MSHTCVCHHTTCAAHILNGLRMHRRPGSQAARAAAPSAPERRWRILRHSACADCAATHACSCCRHTLRTGCAAVRACCCRRSPCTALAARHQLAANFRQTRPDWLDSPIQEIFRNLGKMGLPSRLGPVLSSYQDLSISGSGCRNQVHQFMISLRDPSATERRAGVRTTAPMA